MPKYHLFKSSRCYSGRAYEGPTCGRADIPCPAEFDKLSDAMRAKEIMDKLNPVGFDIYNSLTHERINAILHTSENKDDTTPTASTR